MTLYIGVLLLCFVVVVRAWIPQSASFIRTKRATTESLPVVSSAKVEEASSTRRSWIQRAAFQMTLVASTVPVPAITTAAWALDMEAFAAQQLQAASSTATETTMSEDEGMCRFGQPSAQKGEACVRAGLSTAPLRKGGVDAFGQVDRCVQGRRPCAL
jgi:hypothetical protein